MTREWKPGDVAMAKHPISGSDVRGIIDTDGRFYTTDQSVNGISSSAFALSNLRPLVVIDPEDERDLDRLQDALITVGRRIGQGTLSAALREFANPTPPKPDEPMGLGAVVEDASGKKWVRSPESDDDTMPWNCAVGGWRKWSDIAAVRILSEGVQP